MMVMRNAHAEEKYSLQKKYMAQRDRQRAQGAQRAQMTLARLFREAERRLPREMLGHLFEQGPPELTRTMRLLAPRGSYMRAQAARRYSRSARLQTRSVTNYQTL